MKIIDFYNYVHFCPVCKNPLRFYVNGWDCPNILETGFLRPRGFLEDLSINIHTNLTIAKKPLVAELLKMDVHCEYFANISIRSDYSVIGLLEERLNLEDFLCINKKGSKKTNIDFKGFLKIEIPRVNFLDINFDLSSFKKRMLNLKAIS